MREIPAQPSSAELAQSLQALGLSFVRSAPAAAAASSPPSPASLISALAQSPEARLRLALIPLFLSYPAWADLLPALAHDLPPAPRLTLQSYYTAAVWLQQENRPLLEQHLGAQPSLPDHFSSHLEIEKTTLPGENLTRLARRQRILSAAPVNWLGTYRHAFQVWLRSLQIKTPPPS
jgi:hypothetical protein